MSFNLGDSAQSPVFRYTSLIPTKRPQFSAVIMSFPLASFFAPHPLLVAAALGLVFLWAAFAFATHRVPLGMAGT